MFIYLIIPNSFFFLLLYIERQRFLFFLFSFFSTKKMSANKLKILCLHGYTQNGIMYSKKTAVVRKSIEHLADLGTL